MMTVLTVARPNDHPRWGGWGPWTEGEAVAGVTETAQAQPETRRRLFTAAGLTRLMSVPDPRGPYRAPLLQFIGDWNVARDRAALVSDAPVYDGDDPLLLPTIAVVVHALADRDGAWLGY